MLTSLGLLLAVCVVAHLVVRFVILRLARKAAEHSDTFWDDVLIGHRVPHRLFHVVPALLFYFGVRTVPDLGAGLVTILSNIALAYIALMVMLATGALLDSANAIYERYPGSKARPIKGFLQIGKIAVYVIGSVIVIATLMSKSPLVLLTGFGAMTAVVLLIFRDTILSLVASIQLSSQDMVHVGDWIEMPMFNADGDVIDIALHTITVRNWDKTITYIPTHKLISESYKNWRGMQETGGRRIKRSVTIDVNSVRFLTDEELDRFSRFALLGDYIEAKKGELEQTNASLGETENVNLRKLTNLGTFRAYLTNYLKNHARIHDDMTLIVRQLQPQDSGIPIELYCFTETTDWNEYEGIQADIFDHILAQCGEFDLNVYQSPAGADIRALKPGGAEAA